MGRVFVKAFWKHPIGSKGFSEKWYLRAGVLRTDAWGSFQNPGPAAIYLQTRAALMARNVLLNYAYVSDDTVFRDYIYAPLDVVPKLTSSGSNSAYNPLMLTAGDPTPPWLSARMYGSDTAGLYHSWPYWQGLPDKFFSVVTPGVFTPYVNGAGTADWIAAFANFVTLNRIQNVDANANLFFLTWDKTQVRLPIVNVNWVPPVAPQKLGTTTVTVGANWVTQPIVGGQVRIGATKGTGVQINGTQTVTAAGNTSVSFLTAPPGFTWISGGFATNRVPVYAPLAKLGYLQFYAGHKRGQSYSTGKGRAHKKAKDFV